MADSPVKMEAHGAAAVTPEGLPTTRVRDTQRGRRRQRPATLVEPGPGEAAPGADPFRLGFRYRLRATGDGREVVEQVPLSAEDLLYAQEGDVVSDGYHHNSLLQPEADSLRRHLEKRGATLVTSNVTLVLRSDGRNCSPDIAVIEGEIDRSKIERAVNLRAVGGRLVFALEVVSTSEKEIEEKDTRANLKRYASEEVSEYFTVYPIVERQVKDLVGRRLVAPKGRERNVAGGYVGIPPDAQGRVYSKKLDLFFQIDPASKELVAIDGQTGQRLLISDEEEAGRKKEEAGRKKEEAGRKKEEAALDAAEAARSQAEERAEQEAKARGQAEERAEQEAKARGQAEERAEQEAKARSQAEERAEQEAKARSQAEERAEQGLRRNVEDLCGLLAIDWTAERSAIVAGMGVAQLETLWADLLSQKRWP